MKTNESVVNHTPGPWRINHAGPTMKSYSQSLGIAYHPEKGAPTLIAGVFDDVSGGSPVAEANARLIAAAPEMYAELNRIIADGNGTESTRAIVAKAEGKE